MGCCSSNQADVHKEGHASEASTRKAKRHSIKSSAHDKSCSSGTNFGTLTQLYSPIRLLGSGGCGDTYLVVGPHGMSLSIVPSHHQQESNQCCHHCIAEPPGNA